MKNLRFNPGDLAIIINTNDHRLDGKTTKISGVASCEHYGDRTFTFYIVEIPEGFNSEGWTHMQLIESCLEKC